VTTDPGTGGTGDSSVYRSWAVEIAGAPVAPGFPLLLGRIVRQFDPDIIHSYYPLPFYPDVAALIRTISDTPFVLSCFGAWESSFNSLLGTLGFVYNNTLLKVLLQLADAVHTNSPGVLTDIETYNGYEEYFEIIPPGVDTATFDPSRVSVPPPFETTDAENIILFVGVLRRYKGLRTLIRAFERSYEELGAKLVIVGDGPERNTLNRTISEHDVEHAVELPGHVSDAELLAAYDAADAFVLPSPNIRESFGIVASEALAMGTPVVATSGSGSGHFLDAADVGTIVDPDSVGALCDGFRRLLTDNEYYEKEATEARPFAKANLDWENLIDNFERLYRTALN
jgi:glycosyltransferase involved in cell wall biosynthesis